jgi:hypothetical protein
LAQAAKKINLPNLEVLDVAEGTSLFHGKIRDHLMSADWSEIESALLLQFRPEKFQVSSLQLVASENLFIQMKGPSRLFDKQMLERAVLYLVDQNLEAVQLSMKSLEAIGRIARIIKDQA